MRSVRVLVPASLLPDHDVAARRRLGAYQCDLERLRLAGGAILADTEAHVRAPMSGVGIRSIAAASAHVPSGYLGQE
jgi:hypothetical protein